MSYRNYRGHGRRVRLRRDPLQGDHQPAGPGPDHGRDLPRVPAELLTRSHVPGRRREARDGGMVTAEIAVTLPVLLVVLMAAIWVLACVGAQLRCVDAARVAARAAARGDAPPTVHEAARRVAPAGATISVTRSGDEVTVRAEAVVRPFGTALSRLPGTKVVAQATAVVE